MYHKVVHVHSRVFTELRMCDQMFSYMSPILVCHVLVDSFAGASMHEGLPLMLLELGPQSPATPADVTLTNKQAKE